MKPRVRGGQPSIGRMDALLSLQSRMQHGGMAVRNVLLMGLTGAVVDDAQQQLSTTDVQLFGGTGIDDLRFTFAQVNIDHVIMGAGLDLETRLEIVREI